MQNPVPFFSHSLTALSKILGKAEAYQDAKKIKPDVIPQLRLIADMLPLWRQVTIACDHAKGAPARLAGLDVPSFADTETTLAELKARIAKTVSFIQSVPAEKIDGTEDKAIVTKRGDKETHYTGMQFLLGHAVPNFYFHVSTTYNILRHNGVEIGKRDFLGAA